MKTLIVSSLLTLGLIPAGVVAQQPALTPRDSAFHALNRLAYGPRPGDVPRVAAEGVMRWIDRQLSPHGIDDHRLAERERRFQILGYDRGDLAAMYTAAERERRERKLAAAPDTMADKDAASPIEQRGRRLAAEFADLAVVRAALSERQLYEIMVDFWTNHFNVYFDNWQSVAPGSVPPAALHVRARSLFGRRPDLFGPMRDPARQDSVRRRALERMPKGINENYARELLELHTLGVDGGYTQQDVIDVARIFTGWSIERPQQGGGFEFHDWAHDTGEKQVLGVRFQAGHGMVEGIRLLKLLANHPATMHHLSRKLCQRFVNDDPPDGCVDDAVAAWKRSSGDMRAVLRAIFHGPDFWAAANVRAKVKTPLEFAVSAARAVAAEPDTSPRLAQVVARLGEPLYLHVAPDGYPEREAAWVNSGALLDRMNAAVALASAKLPGVTVVLDSIVSAGDPDQLIGVVNEKILSGTMSENTKQVLRRELAGIGDPAQARALAVGLAIGGPEFQKQ